MKRNGYFSNNISETFINRSNSYIMDVSSFLSGSSLGILSSIGVDHICCALPLVVDDSVVENIFVGAVWGIFHSFGVLGFFWFGVYCVEIFPDFPIFKINHAQSEIIFGIYLILIGVYISISRKIFVSREEEYTCSEEKTALIASDRPSLRSRITLGMSSGAMHGMTCVSCLIAVPSVLVIARNSPTAGIAFSIGFLATCVVLSSLLNATLGKSGLSVFSMNRISGISCILLGILWILF
jgi:hypothetical protein